MAGREPLANGAVTGLPRRWRGAGRPIGGSRLLANAAVTDRRRQRQSERSFRRARLRVGRPHQHAMPRRQHRVDDAGQNRSNGAGSTQNKPPEPQHVIHAHAPNSGKRIASRRASVAVFPPIVPQNSFVTVSRTEVGSSGWKWNWLTKATNLPSRPRGAIAIDRFAFPGQQRLDDRLILLDGPCDDHRKKKFRKNQNHARIHASGTPQPIQ